MKPAARNKNPARLINVSLETESITTRTADIEIERHRAVSDLLEDNSFRLKEPPAAIGPYRLHMKIRDSKVVMVVGCTATGLEENIGLPLNSLRQLLRDYAILCENFYKTARAGQIHRLETLDAGRRSLHDEGAEILIEALENKAIMDKLTARRLFTLLYVLHMRVDSTL